MKRILAIAAFIALAATQSWGANLPPMYSASAQDTSDLTLTGTTTLDGPVVIGEETGPELVSLDASCTNWTLGSGWTCVAGVLTHASDGTASATYPLSSFTPTIGTTYRITVAATATVSSAYASVAGAAAMSMTPSGTFTWTQPCAATGSNGFAVTPNLTGFRGTVTSISVKAITSTVSPGAGPVTFTKAFADTTANEAAVRIVGNQAAGTAGDKTVLELDFVGTAGSGTEYAWVVKNAGTQTASLTVPGQLTLAQKVTTTAVDTPSVNTEFTIKGGYYFANGTRNVVSISPSSTITADSQTTGNLNIAQVTATYNQASGSVANTDLLVSRTSTALGSGTQTGLMVTTPTTTGNPSMNGITVNPTLAAMDNSDTVNLLLLDPASGAGDTPAGGDHTGTGNTLNAINVGAIASDAQAAENAIFIGTGWDTLISWANTTVIKPTQMYVGSAYDFLFNADQSGAYQFWFGQNATNMELTGTTGSQDFLAVKPEWDMSTAADGTRVMNTLHIGDSAGGGYTGTPAAQNQTINNILLDSTIPVLSGGNNTFNGVKIALVDTNSDTMLNASDTINYLSIEPASTDSSQADGGSRNAINVGAITGDAQATETAINVLGGWDTGISLGGTYKQTIGSSAAEGLAGEDLRIGLDESNRTLLIGDRGDMATDLGLSAQSDTTLFVLSAGGTLAGGYSYLNSNALGFGLTTSIVAAGRGQFTNTVNTPQTVTCTAGAGKSALTITPTGSYIEITNSDADGCDITLGESGMLAGMVTTLCIVSSAGTTVDFADTAGVTELAGAFAATVDDCITLRYGNTTTWREVSRSAN